MEKYEYLKFDEVGVDGTKWVKDILALVSSQFAGSVTASSFTARRDITKDVLAKRISSVLHIVHRQNEYITHLEKQCQNLKSEVIVNQGAVIDLQKELIASKDKQLTDIKTTVVASVEDTVKTELKTYSEAVKDSCSTSSRTVYDQETLKCVVKDVVAEEDRSRNLVIFGLTEDTTEQITEKVSEVFEVLAEKPKIEAVRIGLKSKKQAPRPVKVSFSNATIVTQILSKCSALRESDRFKRVFISPDRTPEQRAVHRELVVQMKSKKTNEPNKRHYIKGGQIYSADINVVHSKVN